MLIITTAYAQDNIRIQVNGEEIIFNDQQPIIQDGRVLIPVRGVFDALGYDISWDSSEQRVSLTAQDGTVASFTIGGTSITVISQTRMPRIQIITMDVPAQIINGNTMIPLRAVADAIGADVQWDGELSIAIITYNSIPVQEQEQQQNQSMTITDYSTATFQNLLDDGYSFEQALDIFEEQIFHETNRVRVEHGVQPLAWNDALWRAARNHSQDMAVNGFLNHTGSDGSSDNDRAMREGFFGGANENIAGIRLGFTPASVVQGWMNSPVHHANILRSGARYLGVGIAFGLYGDRAVVRGYAVQKFGF